MKTSVFAKIGMKPNTESGLCSECGIVFTPAFIFTNQTVFACPDCAERFSREDSQEMIERTRLERLQKTDGWKRLCPPEFWDTVPSKLPHPSKLQKILQWNYGPRGLVLHGPTGKGKSRCLWELLKREIKATRTVRVLDHGSGLEYASSFGTSAADAERWVRGFATVDILACDDLFKVKLSESFEAALFHLASERAEQHRPTLWTTNDVGTVLLDRLSTDRGPALVRRIKENCESVSF
jgi:DNA replication protein DnaC